MKKMKNKERYDLTKIRLKPSSSRFYDEIWYEGRVIGRIKVYSLDAFMEWLEEEHTKMTDDEKAIIRNIPNDYGYICRDAYGRLFVSDVLPRRSNHKWGAGDKWCYLTVYDHLFNFIRWEDEPYSVEELKKA